MREYIVRTRKTGDSVVIELPKELLQTEQISSDMTLKITVQKYLHPAAARAKADRSLGPDDPWKLLE